MKAFTDVLAAIVAVAILVVLYLVTALWVLARWLCAAALDWLILAIVDGRLRRHASVVAKAFLVLASAYLVWIVLDCWQRGGFAQADDADLWLGYLNGIAARIGMVRI